MALKRIIKKVRFYLRPVRVKWEVFRGNIALKKIKKHLQSNYGQVSHSLPSELIVSLTSFKPRFGTLISTLECLLSQSVKPDRIILWVSDEDFEFIPQRVKKLCAQGLEIKRTKDTRSFKKIIPSLIEFPDAFIVTADDDVYYHRDWLKILVESWEGQSTQIVCHKAYRILLDKNGDILPYNEWEWNVSGPDEGVRLFPVGVGGVLYPPGSLALPHAIDEKLFMELTPKSNDVWLYWMGRLVGATCKTTHYNKLEVVWPSSQNVALAHENTGKTTSHSAYEDQIKNMLKKYGMPFEV